MLFCSPRRRVTAYSCNPCGEPPLQLHANKCSTCGRHGCAGHVGLRPGRPAPGVLQGRPPAVAGLLPGASVVRALLARRPVRGPPQHGLSSNLEAPITSDCDVLRFREHELALITSECACLQLLEAEPAAEGEPHLDLPEGPDGVPVRRGPNPPTRDISCCNHPLTAVPYSRFGSRRLIPSGRWSWARGGGGACRLTLHWEGWPAEGNRGSTIDSVLSSLQLWIYCGSSIKSSSTWLKSGTRTMAARATAARCGAPHNICYNPTRWP